MKTPSSSSLLALLEAPLDRVSAEPLQRQLCRRIKDAIVAGDLPAGLRLPATRALAQELVISRNTASMAYEHLLAEGYVVADRQGTVVAELRTHAHTRTNASSPPSPRLASRLASLRPSPATTADCTALRPGVPALTQFPQAHWRLALAYAARSATPNTLNYGDPLGELALRAAIAAICAK